MRTLVAIPSLVLAATALMHSLRPSHELQTAGPDPKAVFQAKCISCHSGAQAAGGLDLSADLSVIASSKDVVRSRPHDSSIFKLVASGAMPKGGDHLSAEDVATVRDWVMSLRPDPRSIFQAKCISCHGASNPAAGMDLSGDLGALSQLKQAVTADGTGTDASIYKRVADGSMPKGGTKLSDGDISSIKAWIQGINPNPKPLFASKCASCHGATNPAAGLDLTADLGTLANNAAVTKGAPWKSKLYQAIASGYMPKGGTLLPDSDTGVVWDWIASVKE